MPHKETERLTARYHGDLPEQLRNALRTALLTGHGAAGQIAPPVIQPGVYQIGEL